MTDHRMTRRATTVVVAVLTTLAPLEAQQRPDQQGPERQRFGSVEEGLAASAVLGGRQGPTDVTWIDDGARFAYTARDPRTGAMEVRVFDPASLEDERLVAAGELTRPGTGEPLDVRSFQWSDDSDHLVVQTDFRPIYRRSGISDYYIYSRDEGTLQLAADDARSAELAPDGRRLGYERGGDLYVYDLDADAERRLTSSGSDTIFNGVFDWVYEEEFGQAQAWRWSRDGRRIAFWQTDERGVPSIRLTDYSGQYPDWVEIHYPKVGEENPEVRIGVVDVRSGELSWLDTGLAGEHYIPRVYWTSEPNTLAVMTLNRAQNQLRLFFFDVTTGERRLVLEERSDAWIDVYDFGAGVDDFLYFPDGIGEFFWLSDRDGFQHVYRYGYDGELLGQVTDGPWRVTRVEAIDTETRTVYYTSTEASPLERHLYATGFEGGDVRRLTHTRGTHDVDVSPDARWYIDRWSNVETPLRVELRSTEGERRATLEDNAAASAWTRSHAYSPVELFRFTTDDGVELDGSMIRPPDFDSAQRYPVVLDIYGGPGSQQVFDAFASDGWHQYLAQRGYIVVGLNNRGSGNYGRDFTESVYGRLGRLEARDFAAAGRHLASLPYVDGDRMAITGASYGGYMTVYTMLRHPDVFALGIANSPVTDWRLYDTIYTERYMGLLDDDERAYDESSVLTHAQNLEGRLVLVHSAMDENVHPQNTMQLLTALTDAGKDAELRFYPPGAHGAAYNRASYVTMHEVYANALCEHIGRACSPIELND